MFDGDDDTMVVCEGYSKAFKYLCDLSDFSGGTDCILATGQMQYGTGAGAHMWNIVSLADGRFYPVDVTNSDDDEKGFTGELFLKGSVDLGGGYQCGRLIYVYDSTTRATYPAQWLAVSASDYGRDYRVDVAGTENGAASADLSLADAGTTVTLTLTPDPGYVALEPVISRGLDAIIPTKAGEGVWSFAMPFGDVSVSATFEAEGAPSEFIISADGTLTGYTGQGGEVSIPDGVRIIGPEVFKDCLALTSVTFPDSLIAIDQYAFMGCNRLKRVTVPASVTQIGDYAFYNGNGSGRSLVILGGAVSFGVNAIDSEATVYCYSGTDVDGWATGRVSRVVYLDRPDMDGAREVSLSQSALRLACGEVATLTADVFPTYDNPTVLWASSAPEVASVEGGTITALTPGTATITASVGGALAQAEVRCYMPATDFELPSELWVVAARAAAIPVTVQPEGAELALTWTSADEALATVDEGGAVLGKVPNSDAVITATSDGGLLRSCTVHICGPVAQVAFGEARYTILTGSVAPVSASVTTEDGASLTNRLVDFASGDETIATVDAEGNVRGLRPGVTFVTAGAGEVSATVEVVVCDSLEHTPVVDPAVAPTLYETGLTEGSHCAVCGLVLVEQQVVRVPKGFIVDEDGVLTKYTGNGGEAVIPWGVKAIGDSAFKSKDEVTGVVIPDSVTSIGFNAFGYCSNMTSVTIPESVTEIGDNAFSATGLVRAALPSGLTAVGNNLFMNCENLESVEIPAGVTRIGTGAFIGCKRLNQVAIPAGVTEIGNGAFNGCASLVSCPIPSGVTAIGDNTFRGCLSLTDVVIPEGVTSIGESAFANCANLNRVILPDNITDIHYSAFDRCPALRYADALSETAKALGRIGCSFREAGARYDLRYSAWEDAIEDIAIMNVDPDVQSLVVPEYVNWIGDGAFWRCEQLTDVTLPAGLVGIANGAFSACANLKRLDLPDSVTWIGDSAFYASGIERIAIPAGVAKIDEAAFSECRDLVEVVLADGLEQIGMYAFENCERLERLAIPGSVTAIGESAFDGCAALTLEVLCESYGLEYANQAGIAHETVHDFGPDGLCRRCGEPDLSDFVIEDGVLIAYVGPGGDVAIPAKITAIGDGAFANCATLTRVAIPAGVSRVGNSAFYGCASLAEVSVPEGVTAVGSGAFEGCVSLANVGLPESVTEIGERAFDSAGLEKLVIPGTRVAVGDAAIAAGATVYCYRDCDAAQPIGESGNPVVYLDQFDLEAIRQVSLSEAGPLRLAVGEGKTLSAYVFPDHDRPSVQWTSGAPEVAGVEGGAITALTPGAATITASVGGATASVEVSCFAWATAFALPEEIWMEVGGVEVLPVTDLEPEGAEIALSWSSADEALATVDETGAVTALRPGDARIIATTRDGVARACTAHIYGPVTAVDIQQEGLSLAIGEQQALIATVTTEDGATLVNRLVRFTSADETVATVSPDGIVTAVGEGATTITASNGASAWDSVEVTVSSASRDIAVEANGYEGVYDGAAHGIALQVTDPAGGVTVKYGVEEGQCDEEELSFSDAGTYTVYYEVTAEGYAPAMGSAKVTIERKEIGLSWGTASFTYNGEVQKPTATATGLVGSDACVVYVRGGERKAGTYTAEAYLLGNANYALPATDTTREYTINKKPIGLSWGTATFTYNGEVQKPTATATGLVGSDACVVYVRGGERKAGTYTAEAYLLSNGNYALPANNTKAYTIK